MSEKIAVVLVDGYIRGEVYQQIDEAINNWRQSTPGANPFDRAYNWGAYYYNTEGYQLMLATTAPIADDYDHLNEIICGINDVDFPGFMILPEPIVLTNLEFLPDTEVHVLGTLKGYEWDGGSKYQE